MRAVVYDRYGPPEVLRLEDVARPIPTEDEVLVRIHATTVNRLDTATREANRRSGLAISFISRLVSGLRRPRQRILGTEFAGEVEAVGAAVSEFAVDDQVFGTSGLRFGAHAEFIAMRVSARIAHLPARMSFVEAAPICDGALNALTCLKQADLREGRRIVIFDAVGKHSFTRCRGSLKPGGVYLPTDGVANLMWALVTPRIGGKKVLFQIPPRQTKEGVLFLKELIEAGKYRPVIDRQYPLEDVVQATRYVETEQKVGNVVLTVSR